MGRVVVTVMLFTVLLICPSRKAFALEFFDGRLHEVKGSVQQTLNYRTHQDDRSVKFSSFRTTMRLEGIYELIKPDTTCWNASLYGLFNYWYDNGTNIDHDLKDTIILENGSSNYLKSYKRSNQQYEIMKELYFEYSRGGFTSRLGKQMVSWGETAEARVADVINPLDYNNFVAFPDWEDYKIGLWMGRFFYTPPASKLGLSYELIVIPADFQYNRFPPAGSGLFFGSAVGTTFKLPFGVLYYPDFVGQILNQQRHDAPSSNNTEIGGRIRGQNWGTDWTLSTFYGRLDSPIYDGPKGAANVTNMILNRARNELGVALPKSKEGRIFTYPYYLSSAITFARPWSWAKSVIRGEVVLNSGREYNQAPTNTIVTRELLTTAVSWDRKNMIPYFSYWNRSRSVGSSLTWYHYKLFGFEKGINWEAGKDGLKQSTWDKLTLVLDTGFYFDVITTGLSMSYDANEANTIVGFIKFAPGNHWRWQVTYQQTNESDDAKGKDIGRYQNQLMFSMRYEFD